MSVRERAARRLHGVRWYVAGEPWDRCMELAFELECALEVVAAARSVPDGSPSAARALASALSTYDERMKEAT